MKLPEERAYLNPYSIWGARSFDPAQTENVKSVDPIHDRRVYRGHRVAPKPPTSRFLSPHPSTYLT